MSTRREFLRTAGGAAVAVSLAHAAPLAAQTKRMAAAWPLLDEFVSRRLRELNAPGLTLALADRSGTVRIATYGFADMVAKRAVRPADLFQIGSISKSFCAICALQLRDEGKLDLHQPVKQYLPWLEIDSAAPITLHHLLSHTSGLPDDVPLFPRIALQQRLWTGYAPGTHYSYSNTGYELIGMVLETLEGKPWSEIVRRRVFEPLGMSASEPVIKDSIRPRSAVGYWPYFTDRPFQPDRRLVRAPWVEFDKSSGSISSTPADMVRYMTMLLNAGQGPKGRVITEENFRLMSTGVQDAPSWGKGVKYGYAFAVDLEGGRTVLRHTGGMVAFSSAIHMDLTNGVAGFASTNANLVSYRPNDVVRYALDLMRAANAGHDLPPVPSPDVPERMQNAGDYAGAYTSENGSKFTVKSEGERLTLIEGGKALELLRLGGDRFATNEAGPRYPIQFRRDNDKVVEAFWGDQWFTNEHYQGPRQFDFPREWEKYPGHFHNDDPWLGHLRIFLHKGQLWLENADPLVPMGNGMFRVGEDDWSPERATFDALASGVPLRFNFSGVDFTRLETA